MPYSDELYHFGIKGMRWGVRRYRNKDGTLTDLGKRRADRKYDRLAKKDAKEYARAKMFYGEGAGNRRKLIKNTVEQRRKDNQHYGEAFDAYYSQQNMDKHVKAAKRERMARSSAKGAVRTGRGIFNAAVGNIGRASAAGAGLYVLARATGADKKIGRFVKDKARDINIARDYRRRRRNGETMWWK